jgi:hypothetical protein
MVLENVSGCTRIRRSWSHFDGNFVLYRCGCAVHLSWDTLVVEIVELPSSLLRTLSMVQGTLTRRKSTFIVLFSIFPWAVHLSNRPFDCPLWLKP